MPDFVMSKHALERAVDMAVTAEEILDCWQRPRTRFFNRRAQAWELTRGRITLCIRVDVVPVVTTVLWATVNAFVQDAERGSYGRAADVGDVRRVRRARKAKGNR